MNEALQELAAAAPYGAAGAERSPAADFWPEQQCLIDVSRKFQFSDGTARCIRLAVLDREGKPASRFAQGETAYFFVEFEVAGPIGAAAGGVELVNQAGVVVHGKAAYQGSAPEPVAAAPDSRLRLRQSIELRLRPGRYEFNVGLAGADPESWREYLSGALSYEQFAGRVKDHCRLLRAGSLEVGFGPGGRLSHHGLADLPGDLRFEVLPGAGARPAAEARPAPQGPTVFHITHWKAGSQWIYQILRDCLPDRIIEPVLGDAQVRHYAIQEGFVYPTLYLPKGEFDRLSLPEGSRWFVVIRDLRDTLVSAYFSFKISHPVMDDDFAVLRQRLWDLDKDEGLLYLMDGFLRECAGIQLSWLEAGEPLLKYEDLLERDLELLEETLLGRCGLPIPRRKLEEAVLANRFETQTKGRRRGQEDLTAHQRKAVAGDWRNHFSDPIKRAFKARYGGLLVATGYEANLDW